MRQRKGSRMRRREFLACAALAPYALTSGALGAGARPPASDRIVAGGIGLGGRGTGDLRWMMGHSDVQFVAVCDVRKSRREGIKRLVDARYRNNDCKTYRDLREFLAERPDIDVVLIATGDRWHALASILAMKAGKDVYCEKPGTLTIAEGRALVETATRYCRVFQTGTQRLSQAAFVFATELARTGRLGRLHTVRAHLWPRVRDVTHNDFLPPEPEPPREELDWDLWLGPVPWRPYNRRYVGGCGAWGVYWDLAAGIAGWGSHTIVQCQFAAGAELTSPVEYHFPGNRSGDGLVARFANGVRLVMQFQGWRGSCGVKFEGDEGWASVADGYAKPDLSDPALLGEYRKVVGEYVGRTGRILDHMADFLDCVRTRATCAGTPRKKNSSATRRPTACALAHCASRGPCRGSPLEHRERTIRCVGSDWH